MASNTQSKPRTDSAVTPAAAVTKPRTTRAKPPAPAAAAKKATVPPKSAAAKKAVSPAPEAATPKPAPAAKKVAKPRAKKVVPAAVVDAPGSTAEGPNMDAGRRASYIEVAAYYIAQRRGFAPGDPQQDYLDAAAEIDQLIANGHFLRTMQA